MKVDMEKLDPWSELAFQDLLVDVAAVVACAAQKFRPASKSDPDNTVSPYAQRLYVVV
jgi:hypothetical protein